MSGNESDRRLIEDYLPIEAISKEASREKSVRKGHISTLHLWWARRPLVACRAAVYGALVPASRFRPQNGPEEKRDSLARANAAKFVERLCKYPGDPQVIAEAQRHILEAHAERLTKETGKKVTVDDIQEGHAPRPKVLDMFAGGGAIPLEALRLGCEAYALDLNPVAHIIELCTLVYPQKYGEPNPTARGMTGPKNVTGETTWGGLAQEVRYWGNWVLKKVKAEIGDLYPPIPDPQYRGKKVALQAEWFKEHSAEGVPSGHLMPVAYLWTRTVKCKNPACGATVPLVKQTWLSKKAGRYVAMKMIAPKGKRQVHFEIAESPSEKGLGFDPEAFSKSGNAACPFCGAVADSVYVKSQAGDVGLGCQLMAVACSNPRGSGNIFLSEEQISRNFLPSVDIRRIETRITKSGLTLPDEAIVGKGADQLPAYGIKKFKDIFLSRPLALLSTTAATIRTDLAAQLSIEQFDAAHAKALRTILGLALDRVANYLSSLCIWRPTRSCVLPTFSRQALAMTWDFGEMNPFAGTAGDLRESFEWVAEVVDALANSGMAAVAIRMSADAIPLEQQTLDAVITDPPYYDNVIYSDLSDFFYVWLRRSVGDLYPQHFASDLTPKKAEAVSARFRHSSVLDAKAFYEGMMARSFSEAHRALKSEGALCCVYAHKTTLGWATLVDALRGAGFLVSEAWPVDTEMTGGMRVGTASLASSIFLVARKRDPASKAGNYETDVLPELGSVVLERVETLWEMGISGADLVIACVGAGLRAFTKYGRVDYANGEEVPAERFLAVVETVVLETILGKLSKTVGAKNDHTSLAGLDPATRFYILWRYTYKAADLDAGEAIIFANGTHVELDGLHGLSQGPRPLVEKKKGKYRLLDYTERGDDAKLGVPSDNGQPAPLIDAMHRLLWLMERHPSGIPEFLREARPNTEQMRLVAQALAGPALKGGELGEVASGSELAALTKLTANWRSVVGEEGPLFRGPRGRE